MCDGSWLKLDNPRGGFHNHLFRIIGEAGDFQREDIHNYPDFSGEEGSWFGYGIVAIYDNIYSAASKTAGTSRSGPFTGIHKSGDFETNNIEISATITPKSLMIIGNGGNRTKKIAIHEFLPYFKKNLRVV